MGRLRARRDTQRLSAQNGLRQMKAPEFSTEINSSGSNRASWHRGVAVVLRWAVSARKFSSPVAESNWVTWPWMMYLSPL
jgi:hypothetical protein